MRKTTDKHTRENSIHLTFSQISFSRRATDLRLGHIKQILKFYYITEYLNGNALSIINTGDDEHL